MSKSKSAEDLHLDDFTAVGGAPAIPKYYGEALVQLAAERDDVVCLCAELAPGTEDGHLS